MSTPFDNVNAHMPKGQTGLLVTAELTAAIERCRNKVKKIAAECRKANRKFRDIEFDLINDRDACLHSLNHTAMKPDAVIGSDPPYTPADVRRVTDVFENPQFFVDGATASDIAQGRLGDCWFLSALGVVGTLERLIQNICVEQDQDVGVYGFLFFKDDTWTDVIVDDLLCTEFPSWEALSSYGQSLHHNDKARYNKDTRKGSKNMYFASSKTQNETWVPLLEKAYAKLHGDFDSLNGGLTAQGVEDLTGGVASIIYVQDILDKDKFWNDELMNVGKDRVFAVFTPRSPDGNAGGGWQPDETPDGLYINHAYAVVRAVECGGRRFLRVRNPWGEKEWSGRWSDGSKEWNDPFADQLKKAFGDFAFGNDGEFIQEYTDFLDAWAVIEKCLLFDSEWRMSSQWLKLSNMSHGQTWSHGDVSFTIDVDSDTPAVIVLAQLDDRAFTELSGDYHWSLDFTIYKIGDKDALGSSDHSFLWNRSVKMETQLEKGTYVVHVRVDSEPKGSSDVNPNDWDRRKFTRKKAALIRNQSIAANFDVATIDERALPLPSDTFTGRTVTVLELEALKALTEHKAEIKKRFAPVIDVKTDADGIDTKAETEEPDDDSAKEADDEPAEKPKAQKVDSTARFRAWKARKNRRTRGVRALPSAKAGLQKADSSVDEGSDVTEESDESEAEATEVGGAPEGPMAEVPRPTIKCSGCKEQISKTFHFCTEVTCIRYMLCDRCMKLGVHDATHVFLEATNEDDDHTIDVRQLAAQLPSVMPMPPPAPMVVPNDLVIGLKVYSKSQAVVKGQIRLGASLTLNAFKPKVI